MTQTTERRTREPGHTVRTEPSPKWLRVLFGGATIVDTKRALLLFETGHVPVYYFPMEDVRMDLMEPTEHTTNCQYKGDASYWTVKAGERVAENAMWGYHGAPDEGFPDLRGHVAFYWNRVDAWFEENEQIYVHARDPYKRIDVLPSTRHVKVAINGETVAESDRPTLLFETGMPVRYYLPRLDVRQELVVPSDRITRCPYKGQAGYVSIKVGGEVVEDIAWCYTYPTPEAAKVQGLISFFNERVDLHVDGGLQERPRTPWS